MKLILHIGLGKTGTSAIQAFLAKNVEPLRSRNIVYPQLASLEFARQGHVTSGNGTVLANLLRGRTDDGERVYDQVKAAAKSGRDVLYSSEMLLLFEPTRAAAFREFVQSVGFDVSVLLYVRAIADHAVSGYRQMLKGARFDGDLTDYVRGRHEEATSQADVLKKTIAVFGVDHVTVRNYDAAKGHIIVDFLHEGLKITDRDGFDIDNLRVNRSLSDIEVALMQEMKPIFATPHQARVASDAMIYGDPELRRVDKITTDAMRAIEELCAPDVSYINAHIQGPPITLKSESLSVSDEPEPKLTEAERALAKMIAGLIRMNNLKAFR